MATITISRQMGSQGTEVANALGQRLGYRVVWRDLINQAAARSGLPEVALATIDELGLLGLHPSLKERQAYHEAVRQVIEGLAAQGEVVIVGRAGQVILRDRPDVLHVRIIAPAPLRAERVARTHRVSLEAAYEQVLASDRSRANYLRRYYHAHWDDPELYDLTLNTQRLTPDEAAELACLALAHIPHDVIAPTLREKDRP
jgi:cytidylate kinase